MSEDRTDISLEHFGVKGMKWGVRRKETSSGADGSKTPKRVDRATRKKLASEGYKKDGKTLNRKGVRRERQAFEIKKAEAIINKAIKDPDLLISTLVQDPRTGMPTQAVVTGREFTDYLSRGGAMNPKYTDIWASKNKQGAYEKAPRPEQFVRSDRKVG